MKEIPLSQGKTALVDDEDYPELSKYRWYAHKDCNTFYAVRHSIHDDRSTIRMHAVILNHPVGMVADHIDGNGLNNQRENLRIVTHRENSLNRHIPKSSKYPGVHWDNQRGKWRSRIRVAGKNRHIGYFNSEESAAREYCIVSKTPDWIFIEV